MGPKCFCQAANLMPTLPNADDRRLQAIFSNRLRWVSGTEITYEFKGGTQADQNAVRQAFRTWSAFVSLTFREVPSGGKVRIGFRAGAGAWSYIGTDALTIPRNQSTMNFGWPVSNDMDTALHEIGHMLGLHHEHQHAGKTWKWNERAIIADLTGHPNRWSRSTIQANVLNDVPRASVTGTESVDLDSVMLYPIPANWILEGTGAGVGIRPREGLSRGDQIWADIVYPDVDPVDPPPPPADKPFALSYSNAMRPGEQSAIRFQVPANGEYAISTASGTDTVLVLFQDGTQIAADDNSGSGLNALIERELRTGNEYVLTARRNSMFGGRNVTTLIRRV